MLNDLLTYVVAIASLLDDIAQVPLELDPVLCLQLQVVLLGLLEGLAHLQIELGVVHKLPWSEHALLVREALEDKLELHRVLLELIVVVPLVSIVVPQRVESPRVLTVEVSH